MKSSDELVGPINLGNPQEFSMIELAAMIVDIAGSRSKVVHRPLPEDDPRQRRPDISEAQAALGWKPHTPLREGLVKTVAYFEGLLKDNPIIREKLYAESKPARAVSSAWDQPRIHAVDRQSSRKAYGSR
jgi:UDP-glucuronate decarboxylase